MKLEGLVLKAIRRASTLVERKYGSRMGDCYAIELTLIAHLEVPSKSMSMRVHRR